MNNLSELFKEEPKKEKKLKKKNTKEKIESETDEKLKYYYPLNNNTNDKINEMNPIFLNEEKSIKSNKELSFEKDLLKNIEKNDSTKNENTNSMFNFDNFIFNDIMNLTKANNKEEYENNEEDINEGEEEIKGFFNKSLIDNIEDPYLDYEKDEKSRFFKFDFFNDN